MKEFINENKSLLKGVGASLATALGMLLLPHAEVVIALVLILGVMFLKLDERKRSVLIKTFLIVAIIMIAIVFHIIYCNKKEDVNNTLPEETTQEQEDQKATDNTTPVANTAPVTETTTSENADIKSEGYLGDPENPVDNWFNKASFKNVADMESGRQEADSTVSPEMIGKDGVESEGYKAEAEEAKGEENKKVEQNGDEITIDDNSTDEAKDEVNGINGAQDTGSEDTSWKEIGNGENVDVQKQPVKDNNVVVDKEEQPTTDNKVETEEPAADNKVETEEPAADNKVETEEPATDNKVETEEPATDDKVEIEQPVKVEKLSVEALDGNTAIVGSSIQFKVTGENVTFEGLEGYNYAYNNNILTVQTGSEATVLTIAATDATGETILFDININGIVK